MSRSLLGTTFLVVGLLLFSLAPVASADVTIQPVSDTVRNLLDGSGCVRGAGPAGTACDACSKLIQGCTLQCSGTDCVCGPDGCNLPGPSGPLRPVIVHVSAPSGLVQTLPARDTDPVDLPGGIATPAVGPTHVNGIHSGTVDFGYADTPALNTPSADTPPVDFAPVHVSSLHVAGAHVADAKHQHLGAINPINKDVDAPGVSSITVVNGPIRVLSSQHIGGQTLGVTCTGDADAGLSGGSNPALRVGPVSIDETPNPGTPVIRDGIACQVAR